MQTSATIAVDPDARSFRQDGNGARRDRLAWTAVAAASAFSLFILSRPYRGIFHDADLYIGRAMADADPDGLGRDILFALDGQSQFSLYPRLVAALLPTLGPSGASMALTALGLVAWFAAATILARGLASGRLLWASLIFLAIVPGFYGGFGVFRFAEQFATPRSLAEAAVLAGLAALLCGRNLLAFVAMALAALAHPLMAMPGLAVWLLVQVGRDLRLIPVCCLGVAALLTAAGLDMPVAGRLFQRIDPDWLRSLSANPYLFPSRWPATSWSLAIIQAATIYLALNVFPRGRARTVLTAVLLVAAAGLALALLAGDGALSLLVVQVQPWRALWLMAVAAALLLPVVLASLFQAGRSGRVAAACLVFAWLTPTQPIFVSGAALVAMLAAAAGPRFPSVFGESLARAAWLAVGAYALLVWAQRASFAATLWSTMPADAALLGELWVFGIFTLPIAAATILWLRTPRWRFSLAPAAAASLALVWAAAAAGDDRPPFTRHIDRWSPDPSLTRLIPTVKGEVLWLRNGGRKAWSLAARQSWVSYLQGAGMVFSRELATVWRDRTDRLIAAQLADEGDRGPWTASRTILRPSVSDIAGICAASDGPVAIVVPLDGSIVLPAGLAFASYALPIPEYELALGGAELLWTSRDEHAVISCSDQRSGARGGAQLPADPIRTP